MKLLKEKYKTVAGAIKRAAFENGVAKSEFEHGYKARLYWYRAEAHDGAFRVARYASKEAVHAEFYKAR